MEEFLRAYVLFFRRHSLTSERFRAFFNEYFSLRVPAATLASIDWETWLYKPGMPICLPQVSSAHGVPCFAASGRSAVSYTTAHHSHPLLTAAGDGED